MSNFTYVITGQIESANIQGCDSLYCKYQFLWGQDWTMIAGIDNGITQQSVQSSYFPLSLFQQQRNYINHPLEIALKSTNPFGWPQLLIAVYGPDALGRDVIRGYSRITLPIQPGNRQVRVKLFRPQNSTLLNQILSSFNGRLPEFKEFQFIGQSQGRELVKTSSHGEITLTFHTILKDFEKFGYKHSQ